MKPAKAKVARLIVPAAYYDEALRFVNARRKENGLIQIKSLPPGMPNSLQSCPCAMACGNVIYVFGSNWLLPSGFVGEDGPSGFVGFFDANARGLTLPVRRSTKKRAKRVRR